MEDLRIQLLEDATYIAWLNEEHAEQCLTAEEIMNESTEIGYSDNSQEDELPV